MKTSKPIRVLSVISFFTLIAAFVAYQSGKLDRFFEPEEQPYQSIIYMIPDSVKPVPLDTTQPKPVKEIPLFYKTRAGNIPLMLASSKSTILLSPKWEPVEFFSTPKVILPPLFPPLKKIEKPVLKK